MVFLTFLVTELLILHNLIDVCQMQLQLRKPLCWLNQFSWYFSDLLKSVFHFLLSVFPCRLTFLTYITVLVLLDRCLKLTFIFYASFLLPMAFITHLSLAFLILFFPKSHFSKNKIFFSLSIFLFYFVLFLLQFCHKCTIFAFILYLWFWYI